MSYDLAVFSPDNAPRERRAFLDWFAQETKWSEAHSYDNPAVSTAELRDWFMDLIKVFPPLNGPFSSEQLPEDEDSLTDYSVGKFVIYTAFRWSKEEAAYETVFRLAEKHRVGFFNVSSSSGEVWIPDGGELTLAHSE